MRVDTRPTAQQRTRAARLLQEIRRTLTGVSEGHGAGVGRVARFCHSRRFRSRVGAEGIVLIGADCDGPAAEAAAVSVPAVRDTAENGLPLQMQQRSPVQEAPVLWLASLRHGADLVPIPVPSFAADRGWAPRSVATRP